MALLLILNFLTTCLKSKLSKTQYVFYELSASITSIEKKSYIFWGQRTNFSDNSFKNIKFEMLNFGIFKNNKGNNKIR